MARKPALTDVLQLLYTRSGNECAFPGCIHPIFNDEGLYIAQLCHIKSANKGGQRYDANQTDEERRAYNNLLFLCYRHHKETDDENCYTVEKMIEIKNKHESRFKEKDRLLAAEMLTQILNDEKTYWNRQINKAFSGEDFKIERDLSVSIIELFNELNEILLWIKNYCDTCARTDSHEIIVNDLIMLLNKAKIDYSNLHEIPYYENPFENRNWELHNLGAPNYFSHLALCLGQLKIRVLEVYIKQNPNNTELQDALHRYRKEFDNLYGNTYYAD